MFPPCDPFAVKTTVRSPPLPAPVCTALSAPAPAASRPSTCCGAPANAFTRPFAFLWLGLVGRSGWGPAAAVPADRLALRRPGPPLRQRAPRQDERTAAGGVGRDRRPHHVPHAAPRVLALHAGNQRPQQQLCRVSQTLPRLLGRAPRATATASAAPPCPIPFLPRGAAAQLTGAPLGPLRALCVRAPGGTQASRAGRPVHDASGNRTRHTLGARRRVVW